MGRVAAKKLVDDHKQATAESPRQSLTRAQAATELEVSIASIRRLENRGVLHPRVDSRGVHHHDAEEVRSLRRKRATKLSAGELAAELFDRFASRQSLRQIVKELECPPQKVRSLYHEWLVSLEDGERRRSDPANQMRSSAANQSKSSLMQCIKAFGSLDERMATCIRVARRHGERYEPLEGFETYGNLGIDDLRKRYGDGEYRVTAYSPQQQTVLWEVFINLIS